MATEAENRAKARYNKERTKLITLRLNLKTEADIIEHLQAQPNKQGYIKALIRKDMQ